MFPNNFPFAQIRWQIFPAQLTDKALASDSVTWNYSWTAMSYPLDLASGSDFGPGSFPQHGDATFSPAREINNAVVNLPCYAWLRLAAGDSQNKYYEFDAGGQTNPLTQPPPYPINAVMRTLTSIPAISAISAGSTTPPNSGWLAGLGLATPEILTMDAIYDANVSDSVPLFNVGSASIPVNTEVVAVWTLAEGNDTATGGLFGWVTMYQGSSSPGNSTLGVDSFQINSTTPIYAGNLLNVIAGTNVTESITQDAPAAGVQRVNITVNAGAPTFVKGRYWKFGSGAMLGTGGSSTFGFSTNSPVGPLGVSDPPYDPFNLLMANGMVSIPLNGVYDFSGIIQLNNAGSSTPFSYNVTFNVIKYPVVGGGPNVIGTCELKTTVDVSYDDQNITMVAAPTDSSCSAGDTIAFFVQNNSSSASIGVGDGALTLHGPF